VAEVGATAADDQIYRLSYDGTIVDEPGFLVMGGQAESLMSEVRQNYQPGLELADALAVAVNALGSGGPNGEPRVLPAGQLEVAVLDRTRANRKFKRITGAALVALLPTPAAGDITEASPAPADTPPHDADSADTGDSDG
jgi:proteasome alpha subunit